MEMDEYYEMDTMKDGYEGWIVEMDGYSTSNFPSSVKRYSYNKGNHHHLLILVKLYNLNYC